MDMGDMGIICREAAQSQQKGGCQRRRQPQGLKLIDFARFPQA